MYFSSSAHISEVGSAPPGPPEVVLLRVRCSHGSCPRSSSYVEDSLPNNRRCDIAVTSRGSGFKPQWYGGAAYSCFDGAKLVVEWNEIVASGVIAYITATGGDGIQA